MIFIQFCMDLKYYQKKVIIQKFIIFDRKLKYRLQILFDTDIDCYLIINQNLICQIVKIFDCFINKLVYTIRIRF